MNSTSQCKNIVLRNPNQSLLRCCRSLEKEQEKDVKSDKSFHEAIDLRSEIVRVIASAI